MNPKTFANYVVDILILVALILSALSGIGLMDSHHARSAAMGAAGPVAIDSSLTGISDLHVLSSFLLVVGTLGHLALHWRWMLRMTMTLLRRRSIAEAPAHHPKSTGQAVPKTLTRFNVGFMFS